MAIIPYDRVTNLQNDQALAPVDPYPAPKLDQEYNAIKITTDDIIQHLDLIQRDDGQLENDSVGLDQIREELLIGFNAPKPWVTDHDYRVGDTVFNENAFWYCLVAHHSTTFSADHIAGYWFLIADFLAAVSIGAPMYVQEGPPVLPSQGVQWYESNTGNTYVHYVEPGDTVGQWVQINGGGGGTNKNEVVSVEDYGAIGDGDSSRATKNTTAFNTALANHPTVHVGPGTFYVNNSLVFARSDANHLIGFGRGASQIVSVVPDRPLISIRQAGYAPTPGPFWWTIRDLTLDRAVPATAGGDGILTEGHSHAGLVRDCYVSRHSNGLVLKSCDVGLIENVLSDANVGAGFYVTNSAVAGAIQWRMVHLLSTNNGSQGYLIATDTLRPGSNLIEWSDIATFANSGVGLAVVGNPTNPIHGLKILGGFFGGDGNHEVYIDTHAMVQGLVELQDVTVELNGQGFTGPTASTPASGLGNGIHITANNQLVVLNGCVASSCAQNGFDTAALTNRVTNCTAINNGQVAAVGAQNGFAIRSQVLMHGNLARDTAGAKQKYGVSIEAGAADVRILQNDLRNNVTGPLNRLSTGANIHVSDNLGIFAGWSPPQLTANVNDYAPTGIHDVELLRIGSDAARDITGIVAPSPLFNSVRRIRLFNAGSFPITLKHFSASSLAANRFFFGGVDRVIAPGTATDIMYSVSDALWV
jgi:hypothetical protein